MGKAGKMYVTNTKHVTRNCVIVNLEHCEAARSLLLRIKAWLRKSADKELRVLALILSSLIAYYFY